MESMDAIADPFDKIPETLLCPICMEVPKDKIFQCTEGHHLCESCYANCKVCPSCRVPFLSRPIRNLVAEKLLDEHLKECPYKGHGCTAELNRKTFEEHVECCRYNFSADVWAKWKAWKKSAKPATVTKEESRPASAPICPATNGQIVIPLTPNLLFGTQAPSPRMPLAPQWYNAAPTRMNTPPYGFGTNQFPTPSPAPSSPFLQPPRLSGPVFSMGQYELPDGPNFAAPTPPPIFIN